MSNAPIRLAVIGCGNIAQHAHLPAIQRVEEVRLVAVADPYEEVAQRVAGLNGLTEADACTDAAATLARDDVDAVALCAPTALHAELAIAALRAGKHVLVEKPMAETSQDARAMAEAAAETGKTLMIAYNHSYDVAADHVGAMVDGGELGNIVYAEVFFYEDRGCWSAGALTSTIRAKDQKSFWPRREDPTLRVRDYIHNFDSHVLNLMRLLLGEPRGIEHCRWTDGAGLWAMFDYGPFRTGFKNVRLGQHRFEKGIEICGKRKRVRLELAPPLERYTPGRVEIHDIEARQTSTPCLPWRWPFEMEYRHFAACLLEGHEPKTSGRQALRDVELAEELADMAVQDGQGAEA
jgi:predicted dehydrogenase